MNAHSLRFRLTVWYAGLLAALLALFGASVYFGLGRYLEWSLRESLARQARQIGETYLANVQVSGEDYVVEEINEHYAPEINGRYVRVTRGDGTVLYASGVPQDGSFDPSGLPAPPSGINQANVREEHLARGGNLLIHTLPFTARDGSRFLIEAGAPFLQIEGVLSGLLLTLSIGLPILVCLAVAGGYVVMRQALRPVDELTRSAERITSHNLGERLPVAPTGDELERLSVALNRMVARLEEAFTHIRRFTADASHELRTPLTVLRGELEAVTQRAGLNPELHEVIGSALEETERLSKIVNSLLTISHLDAGESWMERKRFDLAALAESTVEQLRQLAEDKDISLSSHARQPVGIEGDPARVKQVIVNLLDNAIKYTPEGGSVDVTVKAVAKSAVLEVSDSGMGIPNDVLHQIFERFYRVDKARSRQMGGTGLGLAIVKSICAAHGGQVNVESGEGKGSRFRVELPLAQNGAGQETSLTDSKGEGGTHE